MELHLLCEVVEVLIVVNIYGCLGCGFCLCIMLYVVVIEEVAVSPYPAAQ